jgi:uncharacterized DUF497 family protein
MQFIFDKEKNLKLFQERGITFEQAIEIIAEGGVLLDFKHPNIEQYPNQRVMVININSYPYCIPYVMDDKKIVLKTVFPDRRFKYLLEDNNEN